MVKNITSNIIFQLWKKKEYNVKTDGRNFFNQPIEDGLKTCENIRKIATDQSDDYTSIFQKLL